MKKVVLVLGLLTVIAVGCNSQTNASSEEASRIESQDSFRQFDVYKVVDKETGCKYMIVKADSNFRPTMTQMYDKDGLPLCEQ